MISETWLWPTVIPRPYLKLGCDAPSAVGSRGSVVDACDLTTQP